MNSTNAPAMLALSGVFVWLAASAPADELRFSALEQRLASIERQLEDQRGVRAAAFLADSGDRNGACDCNPGHSSMCCTDCGGACCDCGYGSSSACGRFYAEVQMVWMRTHLLSDAFGKLSEQYQFSPRTVLGYEDACGVGARIRYWHYGYTVPGVAAPGIRPEWDVIDLEATGRVQWGGTDVVFAGGLRYADVALSYTGEDDIITIGTQSYGLTFAADVRTLLCCECNSTWSAVYGGRLSVLGGDWNLDPTGFLADQAYDDNWVVQELYAGVEYRCCYCGYDLYTRLVFETQNWHSDFIAQTFGTDSIGFIGPAIHFGATF